MVVSIGHFDTDQDEFVIEGRLHNGAAVPGSSDDWGAVGDTISWSSTRY